jgi:hypothetical protein
MSYSAKWQQAVDRLEIEQQDLLLIMELRKQGLLKSADDSPIKILRKLIEQARMCDGWTLGHGSSAVDPVALRPRRRLAILHRVGSFE